MVTGLLLVAALSVPAVAAPRQLTPDFNPFLEPSGAMLDETPHRYLVELTGAPTSEGGNETSLRKEKDSFKGKAKAVGLSLITGTEYQDLFNGMAVVATPAQARAISRLDGVLSVSPVTVIPAPTETPTPLDPELYTALSQTGADVVQSELGYTGRGIKVAVMDTGVDYNHPALGGCFGHGCRVATGWDFVGDAYNADDTSPSYNPVPTPDPNPDDCAGHGTHVAGIIGANGGVDGLHGVAPDVTFGSYRVFGCEGSTTDEIMMAAMERALKDHMGVLNMSIGSAFSWPQSPTGKAASRLVKKGMVVVASIGNSGANGLFSAGAPGLGEDVIGVASVENTAVFLNTFTISPDDRAIGYQSATGAPAAPTSGTADVMKLTNPIGCTAGGGISENLTGKVALIRRGTCTFAEKAANAQAKGAIGVILYNNTGGRINPTVVGAVPITIPVVSITLADGNVMASRLTGGPVTMTWTADAGSFPNQGGNMISSFSSYGLGPDLSLKPDIAAPGGNIFSTYPLELGGYATLSGTSMSSPHVAGAVALLLQANPSLKAGEVRSVLQNAAIPQLWSLAPSLGLLDSVNRQGAGLLRIDDAILNTTSITPGKIAVGESQAGRKTFQLEIKNSGNRTVTYTLSNVDGVAPGGNSNSPDFEYADTLITFDKATVTVKPRQSVKVKATITPPGPAQMDETFQYGGWIVATPDDNGSPLRVPYAGYVGDYQAIQVLTPTSSGFPWLAKLSGGSYHNQPAGGTFSMTGDDLAYILLHLNHQSTLMRADVMSAGTGRYVGKAWPDDTYLGRNSTATGFFAWAWDGLVTRTDGDDGNHQNDDNQDNNHKPKATPVPAGQYVIKLSILKAGGDVRNPAHWESWTTPTITVTRP